MQEENALLWFCSYFQCWGLRFKTYKSKVFDVPKVSRACRLLVARQSEGVVLAELLTFYRDARLYITPGGSLCVGDSFPHIPMAAGFCF